LGMFWRRCGLTRASLRSSRRGRCG
jgi:hypothetical protein